MTRPHPWEQHYPPDIDWGAPIPQTTLPALLDHAIEQFAPHSAIEFRGRRLTYAELGRRVDRLARGLAALGIGRGDAVALLLPNTPVHPISFFAIARLGARVVHITPLDPARSVIRKLADSGADTLITTDLPGILPQAVQAWQDGACHRFIVADDRQWGEPSPALGVPDGAIDWATIDGPPLAWPAIGPDDLALLQYTGGTTGQPRAAMLTGGNLTSAVAIYQRWNADGDRAIGPGDRIMCVLPLFHIYALTAVMLRCFDTGAELMIRLRFDPDTALADIETGRCTYFPGVPTMWIALVNHPRIGNADLSSLRFCASGGAALPADVGARFVELTKIQLGGGWGMTETSPAGTNLLADREHGPGEIGVPLPGIEMDVVATDDPRRVLPAGETGELRIRGPNVTAGYWQRPDENTTAFADGWFLTGDIGWMSEDGVFTIVDRKKDMIISGGFNVYPRTIEDAIHEHPDIREAAVIGIPDSYRGQAAKAYVVLRDGAADLSIETLRAFLADKLGRHELPTALEIRPELPHTPVGKLAKRELLAELEHFPSRLARE